jgi:hypothetical protein
MKGESLSLNLDAGRKQDLYQKAFDACVAPASCRLSRRRNTLDAGSVILQSSCATMSETTDREI